MLLFRRPLASPGLPKTVTHVLAILSPMSWPCFVTYVLATDPPEQPNVIATLPISNYGRCCYAAICAEPWSIVGHGSARLSTFYIDSLRVSGLIFGKTPGLSGASPHQRLLTPGASG